MTIDTSGAISKITVVSFFNFDLTVKMNSKIWWKNDLKHDRDNFKKEEK